MLELFNNFTGQLNNREISITIWILVFIIWGITQHKIRHSFSSLVKSFFAWTLTISYVVMFFYIAIMLLVLNFLGIWQVSHIVITILWILSVAFVMLFNTPQIRDTSFFRNTIKDNLKILIILEFIINLYVFSIWIELLLFPFFIILGGLMAFSKFSKQNANAQNNFNYLMAIIGTFFIGYALYMAVFDFNNFFTLTNFKNFILPIFLTIMFLPFIYFYSLYISYDTLFKRLLFFIKDKTLLPYLKKKTFLAFGLNLFVLNKWAQQIHTLFFNDEESVDAAIRMFKDLKSTINENI